MICPARPATTSKNTGKNAIFRARRSRPAAKPPGRGTRSSLSSTSTRPRTFHYDLRLELEGVLKSWAVPKGPPLDAADKKLAMMVEDHPFDYRTFEGVIPEGSYGAGTVMIWDRGTYRAAGCAERVESEEAMQEGLARGHISFVLDGQKLKGEFALVRLKKAGENSWLLIKKKDDFAQSLGVPQSETSVASGRTMEEIATDGFADPP